MAVLKDVMLKAIIKSINLTFNEGGSLGVLRFAGEDLVKICKELREEGYFSVDQVIKEEPKKDNGQLRIKGSE